MSWERGCPYICFNLSLSSRCFASQRQALSCASLGQQRACTLSKLGLGRLLHRDLDREGHIAAFSDLRSFEVADDFDWDLQVDS